MKKLLLLLITVFFLFYALTSFAQKTNKETCDNPSARYKYAFALGVVGGIWKRTNFLSVENNLTKINDCSVAKYPV